MSVMEVGNVAKVRKYIERQLMGLAVGEKLTPVRKIISESGSTRTGVENALGQLVFDGYIHRKPRQGIIKAARCIAPLSCVDLVAFVDRTSPEVVDSGFQKSMYSGILTEACAAQAGDGHQSVRIHYFDYNISASIFERFAARNDLRACILLWSNTPTFAKILDDHNVAYVSLHPRIGPHGCCSIYTSPDQVRLQLEHLWQHGHSRIAYLYPGSEKDVGIGYSTIQRRETYYRLMAENGFKVGPNWVVSADYKEISILSALEKIFKCEPYPTAAIVADPHLPVTCNFLENRGISIGKRFSIVGTDDIVVSAMMSPPVTSVHNSPLVAAKMAFENLTKILHGEKVEKIQYVPAELVVRQSTGPVV